MQHEAGGPGPGFWPILEPERCKLQCSGHVAFWGALREPSVPYNWTSGAFGTFGPIWSQPGPGEACFKTPLRRHEVARGGPSRFAKPAARKRAAVPNIRR